MDPQSGSSHGQQQSEKPGILKRFLNWIAKGADKTATQGNSCPT